MKNSKNYLLSLLILITSTKFAKSQSNSNSSNSSAPVQNNGGYGCPTGLNPTQQLCDHVSKPCQFQLFCNFGRCSCPGNMIFSMTRCTCNLPAGTDGCSSARDCTDGAHCYHPPPHRHCHHHFGYHSCVENQPANKCHCCVGPRLGLGDGSCQPSKCAEGLSGELSGSTFQLSFALLLILAGLHILLV